MLQKHPEINQGDQVIGWQPVYSTQQNQPVRSPSSNNFLMGIAASVAIGAVMLSGSLLWNRAEKTEAELNLEIQQAVNNERERITQCVTTLEMPKGKGNRQLQTVGNR